MANPSRSILQKIFGDELGSMLAVFIVVPLAMLAFMALPTLMTRISSSSKSKDSEILDQLPASSKELLSELSAVQIKTQQLIQKLSTDTQNAETLLAEKQSILGDLQKRIALLQLTPEQRAIVEQYNSTITKDPTLKEWISRRSTRYEIFAAILVSWFFYFLGKRQGKRYAQSQTRA